MSIREVILARTGESRYEVSVPLARRMRKTKSNLYRRVLTKAQAERAHAELKLEAKRMLEEFDRKESERAEYSLYEKISSDRLMWLAGCHDWGIAR